MVISSRFAHELTIHGIPGCRVSSCSYTLTLGREYEMYFIQSLTHTSLARSEERPLCWGWGSKVGWKTV